jgi:hypothetical protein
MEVDNRTVKTDIPNLKILPNGCFNIAILIGNGALVTLKQKKYNFLSREFTFCSSVYRSKIDSCNT